MNSGRDRVFIFWPDSGFMVRAGFGLWLIIAQALVAAAPVQIAVILDDLGQHLNEDLRIARLPGAVTCSILPMTPHAQTVARVAHAQQKEILLHLPLEAESHARPGSGALLRTMNADQVADTLAMNILSIPYVVGINNHMGSLATQDHQLMGLLMQELAPYSLFFIDSRTSPGSVAEDFALQKSIRTSHRDIFLDNEPQLAAVTQQWHKLLQLAWERGSAIAIGHPNAATIEILAQEIPRLAKKGVELVPVSQLLNHPPRSPAWRLSSSR